MIFDSVYGGESVSLEYSMGPIEYNQFVEEYNHWLDTTVAVEEESRINRLFNLTFMEEAVHV